jgi:hypothetical protein
VNSTRAKLTYIAFLLETNSAHLGLLLFGPFQTKEENVGSLLGLFFDSEDGGDMFFRNFS